MHFSVINLKSGSSVRIAGSFRWLRCFILGLKGSLSLLLLFIHGIFCPVQAGLAVFDAQNLAQMLTDSIGTIEQWGIDNEKQLQQLQQLLEGNEIARLNSTLGHLESWALIDKARADSLALVHSASAVWREYGDLSDFIASFETAQAWESCFRRGQCSFESYLQDLDEFTVQSAREQAQQAERMQQHLAEQAQLLKSLKTEGQGAVGQAEVLDNMAKINAQTASSMVSLNSQSAQLLSLISKEQAQRASERQVFSAQEEAFVDDSQWVRQSHLDLTLPAFK